MSTIEIRSLLELDASRIAPRLYQGARPPTGETVSRAKFDLLVLAAKEFQPPRHEFPRVVVHHAPMNDDELTQGEILIAETSANHVATWYQNGFSILVTCHMGINRSGLIVGIALTKITGQSGKKMVEFIQKKRPGALTNKHFVRYLERIDAVRYDD